MIHLKRLTNKPDKISMRKYENIILKMLTQTRIKIINK